MTVPDNYAEVIEKLLGLVDEHLPRGQPSEPAGQAFGAAAVRHAANLLATELELGRAGRWDVTRLVGRAIFEAWLWANLLLLDGDAAIERLLGEDTSRQGSLDYGRGQIWQRLESLRPGGIDLRGPTSVPWEAHALKPNVEELATSVRAVRERQGLGGGISEVGYQLAYRWESVHDVHVGLDVLMRYISTVASGVEVSIRPGPEDVNQFRGPESLYQDAHLVSDALGVYLSKTGQEETLEDVKNTLAQL